MDDQGEVTRLLGAAQSGDANALNRVVSLVYRELEQLAHRQLARERPDHTLDTGALVHEAFLKVSALHSMQWQSREHFLAMSARLMRRILVDYAAAKRAQKRGGGAILPFEVASGEERYRFEPLDNETPEHIFERDWAVSLLDRVVSRLKAEFIRHGSLKDFDKLKVFLSDVASNGEYTALAGPLGMEPGGVAVAVYRLRLRYREIIRTEITQTVTNESEMETEMHYLFAALD